MKKKTISAITAIAATALVVTCFAVTNNTSANINPADNFTDSYTETGMTDIKADDNVIKATQYAPAELVNDEGNFTNSYAEEGTSAETDDAVIKNIETLPVELVK